MSDEENGGTDSLMAGLTTAARSRKGRSMMRSAAPWIAGVLASALTATLSWVASKMDSKAELTAALELRNEMKRSDERAVTRHAEVVHMFATLEDKLLNDSVSPLDQGRVVRLEKGQYFAWRALAELHAAAYTDQPERRRRRMDELGNKFASKFDKRAQNQPPPVAYDELFAQVHVE